MLAFGAAPTTMNGGLGNDVLAASGATGGAVLDGGDGNDIFSGGTGNDSLIGGTGNDTFFFAAGSFGTDTVVAGNGEDVLSISGHLLASVHSVDNGNGSFTIDFGGADTVIVTDLEWLMVDDGSVRIA